MNQNSMNEPIKIYIAGKILKDSSFGTPYWREPVAQTLQDLSGIKIINLDPTKKTDERFPLDEYDSRLIFGRDSYMIRSCDVFIVYLSDDISVGGSQEMLIAKYFGKPVIGIAPIGGKFRKDAEIYGKMYKNHVHPFVNVTCDYLADTVEEAAEHLKTIVRSKKKTPDISVIDRSMQYYAEQYLSVDVFQKDLAEYSAAYLAYKGLVLDLDRERMLVIRYADMSDVNEKARGRYGMPGGKLYDFADLDGSFESRVHQETGVTIKSVRPFDSWSWSYDRGAAHYTISAIAQVALYKGGELVDPTYRETELDLERGVWLPLDNIDVNDFICDEQLVMNDFLETLSRNPKCLGIT